MSRKCLIYAQCQVGHRGDKNSKESDGLIGKHNLRNRQRLKKIVFCTIRKLVLQLKVFQVENTQENYW